MTHVIFPWRNYLILYFGTATTEAETWTATDLRNCKMEWRKAYRSKSHKKGSNKSVIKSHILTLSTQKVLLCQLESKGSRKLNSFKGQKRGAEISSVGHRKNKCEA